MKLFRIDVKSPQDEVHHAWCKNCDITLPPYQVAPGDDNHAGQNPGHIVHVQYIRASIQIATDAVDQDAGITIRDFGAPVEGP